MSTINDFVHFVLMAVIALSLSASCNKGSSHYYEQPIEQGAVVISDEISNTRINAFVQDTSGHIWIGTFRGLNRLNAHNVFQYYSTEDETSLPNNEVFRLHVDQTGRMWVSTTSGIAFYTDREDFHRPKNWNRTLVYQIAESPDGRMFFNDRSRIYEYLPDLDSLKAVLQYKENQSGATREIRFFGNGTSAIVWPDSLSIYDSYSFSHLKTIPVPSQIGMSAEGPMDRLWLGTENGPVLFDPYDGSFIPLSESVKRDGRLSDTPRDILQYDENRTLFLNRAREIVMYDSRTEKISRYGDEGFPFRNEIIGELSRLYKDSAGNVWVSLGLRGYSNLWTSESGFNTNASLVGQLDGDLIQSMAKDNEGRAWFATSNGTLRVYDPSEGTVKTPLSGSLTGSGNVGGRVIQQIFGDSHGNLYVFFTSGATVQYTWDGEHLKEIDRWNDTSVLTFMEDRNGTVWIGGFRNAITALLPGGNKRAIPIYPSGGYYQISMLAETSAGFLVGAHPWNIQVFDPETGEHHPLLEERVFKEVLHGNLFIPTCVLEDKEGFIWIGTDTCGLLRYDTSNGTLEEITGAPCEDICSVEEDENGNMWVSSLAGIGVWDRSTETFHNYSSSDGTGGNQFNDRCSVKLEDGTMIFGGYHGITTINPSEMEQQADIPLNLEYLRIHNELILPGNSSPLQKRINLSEKVTLNHRQNGFSIGYGALDYQNSGSTRYSYRLEGVDKYWVEAGNSHEAYYSNPSPGKHLFRVRIGDENGTVMPKEVSLMIKVKASPWISWYAILAYLTILTFILAVLSHYWIRARRSAEAAKKAEMEKEEERRINKMNMSFFANVAHEFRTPLTLISGPVSLLSASPNTDKEEKRLIGTVQKSVDRMLKLINQLLDFNRLEGDSLPLSVYQKDIVPIIKDGIDMFREQAKDKDITLEEILNEKEFPMPVDEDKIGKVLTNLLSNAMKYTPENGAVSVIFDVISSQEAKQTSSHPENLPDSRYARIRVSDTGVGIPENLREKIFDRYFQVKDSSSGTYNFGTGIGLYYVKRLVKLHHGDVWASDRITGKGTTMTVLLPCDPEAYSPEEAGISVPQPKPVKFVQDIEDTIPEESSDGRKTILVVDDDIDVASYLKDILSSEYNVICRHSADAALEAMKTQYPDVVLSDVAMPGKDGYDFCREIKRDNDLCHLPVILVTAKTTVENQIEGLDSGADAYVTKPFDPFYLRSLIRSQIDNRDRLKNILQTSTSTEEIDVNTLSEQDGNFLDSLYKLMEEELSNPDLDVEKMAESLFISRSKLFYKVKGLTGETPIGFFKQYKLSRAAELLKEGKLPISQISDMTGFSSPSKFSSLFKKRFGVPPSEYKG